MYKYILIFLATVGLFIAGYFTANKIKGTQYDKQIQTIEADRAKLTQEQAMLKQQYTLLEEKAAVKDQEVEQLHALISANNKGLEIQANKISEATRSYESEISTINTNTDNLQRCLRLCATRAELGFKCSANFCDRYK